MIAETIRILQEQNYYGVSKSIEIAKGKNEKIYSFTEAIEKIYRTWRLSKR